MGRTMYQVYTAWTIWVLLNCGTALQRRGHGPATAAKQLKSSQTLTWTNLTLNLGFRPARARYARSAAL